MECGGAGKQLRNLGFLTILSIIGRDTGRAEEKDVASSSYISARELKRLSILQPWRTALAIAIDWAVIILAIALCEWSGSWWPYLPAVLVIAATRGRQVE